MGSASFKTSSRRLIYLFILLFLISACIIPNFNAQPTTSTQYPDHMLVSLTEPLDGEAYPIDAGLSIRGEAISDGSITSMELWVDGEMYKEYKALEKGLGLLVHNWTWSPESTGAHTLFVRAYNDQNQSTFSNSITIKGIPDPGFVLLATAKEGDTSSKIAERYHVSINQVLLNDENLAEGSPLIGGEEISVNIMIPSFSSVSGPDMKGLMKLKQWSEGKLPKDFLPQSVPSPPELAISSQGCTAILSINDVSDNEQGFNIYRLTPGAISFSKLSSLGAHNGGDLLSYTDSTLSGLYHYYVAAQNTDGESKSNLVSVNIEDINCSGKPTLIADLVSIPDGVEDYYLYVSINNTKPRRIPAEDFNYLKKSLNLDFGSIMSELMPNLSGGLSIKGEVWGMVNGAATLLGTFDKSLNLVQSPVKFEPGSFLNLFPTRLEVRGVYDVNTASYPWLKEKGMNYGMETFHYFSDTNSAYGIWQVTSVPFQPDTSFNPTCLLLAGKANGNGSQTEPFEFGIVFSQIKPKVESVQLSPFENILDQTPVFLSPFSPEKLNTSTQQTVVEPKWGVGAIGMDIVPEAVNFDPCSQNVSTEGITTYYIRLIPMNNGQAAGGASNTVKMMYDPEGQIKITIPSPPVMPVAPYYDVKILNFTGVHVPENKYEYCVEVVENKIPSGSLNPWVNVKPGDKICPKVFKGGNEDDLLNVIEDALNYISGLYNKLSDWATELVDKLNPLCIQAKLGSSALKVGEKEVKDACHFIAAAAVTAAKAYVGLPPSLPSYDQLTDLGKQNLVDLAAQELENSGVPCPEECKDVIRKGIDYSIEQLKANMTNSSCLGEQEAHENGIEPLCTPPGIITKPDPRGQPAPAVVEVQITRRSNSTGPSFPEPTVCNVDINVSGINSAHFGESFVSEAGFHWNGAEIKGNLLNGMGAFPGLKPGESTKLPIILSPSSFWLEGHKDFVKKGWKPEHYDDWYILYQGAMATIDAGGSCKFELPEGT